MKNLRELYTRKFIKFEWDEFHQFLCKEVYKKPVELHKEDSCYWFVFDPEKEKADDMYTQEDYEEGLELIGKALGMNTLDVILDEQNVFVMGV